MKQSVDLTNSMKPMNSRHSNTGYRHSNTVTGFARRVSTTVLPGLARRDMIYRFYMTLSADQLLSAPQLRFAPKRSHWP